MTETQVRSKTLNPQALETLELLEFQRNGGYNWQFFLDFVGLIRLTNPVHSVMQAASIDNMTQLNLDTFMYSKSFSEHGEHLNKILVYLEHVKAKVFYTDQTLFVNFALLRFYVVYNFIQALTRPVITANQVQGQVSNWKLEMKKQMELVRRVEEQKNHTWSDIRNSSRKLN